MENEKFWFVYLLLCDQKTFYVGITTNVLNRLNQHRKGLVFFTKRFSDHQLVYSEKYSKKAEAVKRE